MIRSSTEGDFVSQVRREASEAASQAHSGSRISHGSLRRSRRHGGSEVDLRSHASSRRSYGSRSRRSGGSSYVEEEKAFTLEEQQKAVQDAAFERYITNLQKEAKQTVIDVADWQKTVQGGLDEDEKAKSERKKLCQMNQAQLKQQMEHNKAIRAERRREYIEAASSHSYPLFTETFISLPEVEEYERQRKINWRKELDLQKKTNDMLRNIEEKKNKDQFREMLAQGVKSMKAGRMAERHHLVAQGKELVRAWERDVRLKDIKKAIDCGKDVVQELESPKRRR
eukprot:TRINITY_DN1416_c0_g1_i1.p1 TRINITY_DN1416_c0_g1~~TRINITY_DN1416_c0_g1_i1.p1  ORF type:complete len:302 (+),score=53.20 TRINITY_DN1416_c0_g1_i1:58-906(+)